MNISTEIITLTYKYPFTIARQEVLENTPVVIHIEHEGVVGMGEAQR